MSAQATDPKATTYTPMKATSIPRLAQRWVAQNLSASASTRRCCFSTLRLSFGERIMLFATHKAKTPNTPTAIATPVQSIDRGGYSLCP